MRTVCTTWSARVSDRDGASSITGMTSVVGNPTLDTQACKSGVNVAIQHDRLIVSADSWRVTGARVTS